MLSSTLGSPPRHDAVDRQCSRPARTTNALAGHDLVDRDLDAARRRARRARSLRLQPHQPFDRRRGVRAGARLEQLAEQHQRDDGRAGLEVDVLVVQTEQRDDGAEAPRHRRAERDQHIHVGAAAAQRVPRADVEAAADPELHRRGEQRIAASGAAIRRATCSPSRSPRAEHRHHLREQRQRQHDGDQQFASSAPRTQPPCARLRRFAIALRVAADDRAIAGALDRGEQLRGLASAGSKRTVAVSVAKLTAAWTPGTRLSTFSMRAAHAAQVMPSRPNSTPDRGGTGDCRLKSLRAPRASIRASTIYPRGV